MTLQQNSTVLKTQTGSGGVDSCGSYLLNLGDKISLFADLATDARSEITVTLLQAEINVDSA